MRCTRVPSWSDAVAGTSASRRPPVERAIDLGGGGILQAQGDAGPAGLDEMREPAPCEQDLAVARGVARAGVLQVGQVGDEQASAGRDGVVVEAADPDGGVGVEDLDRGCAGLDPLAGGREATGGARRVEGQDVPGRIDAQLAVGALEAVCGDLGAVVGGQPVPVRGGCRGWTRWRPCRRDRSGLRRAAG